MEVVNAIIMSGIGIALMVVLVFPHTKWFARTQNFEPDATIEEILKEKENNGN